MDAKHKPPKSYRLTQWENCPLRYENYCGADENWLRCATMEMDDPPEKCPLRVAGVLVTLEDKTVGQCATPNE